ncbi:MAG TPA: glycoside hydrolase family 19 protein [Xanthobacteraceae bacterium]|nr:glycoside hydrolase family 19 protein [Xanthobacteraceae bacterium]
MSINRDFFFSYVRQHLFAGSLNSSQVKGLTGILDEWEGKYAANDDRWLAYALATTHHETDRKFQPIKEYGGPSYYMKMYDVSGARPTLARKMGHTAVGDGKRYFGRGFVQLTWKVNYRKASTKLGFDFVANPDAVMDPKHATQILFVGMIEGWFTGKKLGDYFSKTAKNWVGARRIINGTDKANLIADYGRSYYAALSYTL